MTCSKRGAPIVEIRVKVNYIKHPSEFQTSCDANEC
jgi:hypothetical protein